MQPVSKQPPIKCSTKLIVALKILTQYKANLRLRCAKCLKYSCNELENSCYPLNLEIASAIPVLSSSECTSIPVPFRCAALRQLLAPSQKVHQLKFMFPRLDAGRRRRPTNTQVINAQRKRQKIPLYAYIQWASKEGAFGKASLHTCTCTFIPRLSL
jgi:hypothetical protein